MIASRLRVLLLALAGLFAASSAALAKDQLVIGITQFPSSFHPSIDSMLAKSYIHAMTARRLTMYGKEWEVVCMLCTTIPSLENGLARIEELPPDVEGTGDGRGIAITFELRPDAKWGDGTPVTTDDIAFTIEVGQHPQSGITNSEGYRRIWKVDVADARTITLHVDRVSYDYALADMEILPAHLERPVFEASPADYRVRTVYDTDPTNPGLSFGPYYISEVEPGSHVVLSRNPHWWGAPGYFETLVVRVIENTAALEANLLSGSIDMIAGELGLTLDQALAFEQRHGDEFQVIYQPGLIYEHIDLKLENPILADVRMRRALIQAIDRDAISRELFGGRQEVANGGINPLDGVYDPDVPKYAYDPDAAAALLDEAGWTEMKDGIRHNAAGEPLRLEFMTTAGSRSRELVQQVLQDQWRQAGIDIVIRNEPARVYFGKTLTERRYTGLAMYAWISSPENSPRLQLHSEQIPTEENAWIGQNYPGYANPVMDDLIDRLEVELDFEKRVELWAEIQRIYAEDLPALPLYFRAEPYILPKQLKGVHPTGHQRTTTYWVEEWYWQE